MKVVSDNSTSSAIGKLESANKEPPEQKNVVQKTTKYSKDKTIVPSFFIDDAHPRTLEDYKQAASKHQDSALAFLKPTNLLQDEGNKYSLEELNKVREQAKATYKAFKTNLTQSDKEKYLVLRRLIEEKTLNRGGVIDPSLFSVADPTNLRIDMLNHINKNFENLDPEIVKINLATIHNSRSGFQRFKDALASLFGVTSRYENLRTQVAKKVPAQQENPYFVETRTITQNIKDAPKESTLTSEDLASGQLQAKYLLDGHGAPIFGDMANKFSPYNKDLATLKSLRTEVTNAYKMCNKFMKEEDKNKYVELRTKIEKAIINQNGELDEDFLKDRRSAMRPQLLEAILEHLKYSRGPNINVAQKNLDTLLLDLPSEKRQSIRLVSEINDLLNKKRPA